MKELVLNRERLKNYLFIWCVGFVTHLYIFTNKFYNEDDMNNLTSKAIQTNLGRWFEDALAWIFPTYSISMINGPLAIFLLVIAAILICRIFEIKSAQIEILIGCIFVTFPVLACNFTWMSGAHRYAVAILLSVMFDYFLLAKNFKGHSVIAIACLVLSLGTYQIYLCLAMGILWIWVICYTLKQYSKREVSVKEILKKIIGLFICAVISVGIYGIITKIILNIVEMELASYQNIDKIFDINLLTYFLGILKSYYRTLMFLFGGLYGTPSFYIVLVHILILGIVLYGIWKIRKENVGKGKIGWKLLLVCELVVLPVFIESIEVMAATAQTRHMIMRFGSVLWYIIPVIFLSRLVDSSKFPMKRWSALLSGAMVLVICVNIYICNLAYFRCSMTTQNLEALLNRVASAIEQTEGYVPNETKVWIDSDSGMPLYTSNQEEFGTVSNMIGISDQYRFFELRRLKTIMENFLYFQSEDPTEKEIEMIKESKEYAKMNAYPLENSIEWINDVLVVKMTQ